MGQAATGGLTLDVLALGLDVPRPALEAMAEAGGGRFAWAERPDQTADSMAALIARPPVARALDARLTASGGVTWLGTTRPPAGAANPWWLPVVALPMGEPVTPAVLLVGPAGTVPTFQVSYVDPSTGEAAASPGVTSAGADLAGRAAMEPAWTWLAAITLERASSRTVAGDLDGARAALRVAIDTLAPHAEDSDVAQDLADLELFLDNLTP